MNGSIFANRMSAYFFKTAMSIVVVFSMTFQVIAQSSTLYDFNTTGQLPLYFNQGGSATNITQQSTGGIGNSGCIAVTQTSTNEVFASKAGYALGPVGSTYTFTSNIKSIWNSGYSGLGFTTASPTPQSGMYACPAISLGISVHGGGFVFHNNSNSYSGSWNSTSFSGGTVITNASINDLLNNGSPDSWYKVVFKVTRVAASVFNMRVEIWPISVSGALINPSAASAIMEVNNVTNNTVSTAPLLYSYFAFAGSRVSNFDNFSINLVGSSVIQAGAPVVLTTSSSLSSSIVTVNGNVTSENGSTVTERGFVYGLSQNPTTSDNKVIIGSGLGTFSGTTPSLGSGTYYFRAYAINSTGTSYGSQEVQTLLSANTNPTISSLSNVTNLCSGGSTSALAFTVADAETASGSLVVTASSSNTTLIPNANVLLTQPNSSGNAQVSITAASGQTGNTTITLTVTDADGGTSTSAFNVTVTAPNDLISINNSLCGANTLQWMTLNNVTPTTASGSGQNGITLSVTHSVGGMLSNNGMYQPQDFPSQYNVPGLGTAVIQNNQAGNFQACFSQPVTNPVVAFSSIGNPSTPVTVTVSQPYSVVWSGTGTTWTSSTQFVGQEGDNIIRLDGTVSCVNFNYGTSETYCTIAFGFENQNCYTPTICSGQSVSLTASGATNYSWSPSTGLNTTSGATVIASPTTTTTYTVVDPSNSCVAAKTITVTVNPTPSITNTLSNSVNCRNTVVAAQSFTSNVSGSTFAWTNSNTAIGLAASGTGSVPSFTATNNTSAPITATITVTPTSPNLCSGTPVTYTITVNPTPSVNTISSQTVCAGASTTSVVPAGNVTGAIYNWTNSNSSVGLAASGSGTIPSFTAVNNTATAANATITVTPVFGGNMGTTYAATSEGGSITLNAPAGTYFTGVQFASYGTPTGSLGNYTIGSCHATNSASVVGALAIGQTSVTIPADNATFGNPCGSTAKTLAVVLTYGTFGSACQGTPTTYTYTVNPLPVYANRTANVCSGAVFTGTSGGTDVVPAGTQYTWSAVDNPNVVGETNATIPQSSFTQTLVNAYTSSQQVVYSVTPLSGSCIGQPYTYTLTLSTPVAVSPITGATNLCLGSTTQLASATSGGVWTSSNTSVATVSASGVVSGLTTGTATISYTVTNASGCTGVVSAVVNVNALPIATVTPSGATTFCSGSTVTLTASTGASYLWSNGLQTQSITVNASGNYSVTVTNTAGCAVTSAPVAVVVNALPVATVSASGPTTFCQGGSVTLTASAGSTYLWSNGLTTQSITVSTSGSYSVTVTNANGCFAISNATQVTVNALPTPSITSLNGNTFCQGGSVTLVSTPGSIYAWSNGLTTQSIEVSASANLTVTVTNANGCSATSAPFAVTMHAAPVATVTANGPTSFCQGGQVTLSAPSAVSYLWNSGETTQTIIANLDGPYTVTITDANGCSATSANMNITVLPIPTVAAIAGSNEVCEGSTLNLTNATNGGVWASSNTTLATVDANGVVTALAAGNVTISYSVTNTSGCTVTSSMIIHVNALPTVAPITGANNVCLGNQVVYSNTTTNGTWSSSNVGIATVAQNGVVNGIAPGTATITYTVENTSGCVYSVSKVITVNALPVTGITANGPLSFCQGGSVTLTGIGGTSYVWSDGTPTASITVNTSGSYSVEVADANGCVATSAPVFVNVWALPNATISSTGSTVCLGNTVTLTAAGGVNYSWSNGANTASTTVNSGNTYTVTVTDANGCVNTASNIVTVNPNPAVVVAANGPLTFCAGGSVTLHATGATSYVWNDGTIGSSINISQSGTYYVQGTNSNGCTSNSAVVTVNVLSIPVVAAITGSNTVCESSTVTLSSATQGGAWSSSNSFIASVNNTGVVTGVNAGTAIITYTVSNGACNASVSASITVMNSPATPVITAGGPTTVCPGETVNLFSSNAANYQWNSGQLTNNILVTQSGSYSVTVIGSNGCAVNSLPVYVTIGDNIAPTIVAPLNVNVNPNLGCTAVGVSLGSPIVADNCSVATVTNDAPSLFPIGTTTITWTVTDASGNMATATQLVNVVDQIAPVATAPEDITVNANNYCEATGVNLGTPITSDNCTIATITNDAPSTYSIGTTIVTWTITDASGNFTTVTQNVTVVDNMAPVVLLQSTVIQLDANGHGALTFGAIDNGSNDNCGIASVVLDQTVFNCSQVGFNTVNVTITDNNGNQSKGSIVINVLSSDACGTDEFVGPAIPDVFTPNGNSVNDTWVIPGLEGYSKKQMAVYSRYGTLVYYSAIYANDWDGTLMGNGVAVPDGTYYYILDLDGGKQLSGYVYINRVKQ